MQTQPSAESADSAVHGPYYDQTYGENVGAGSNPEERHDMDPMLRDSQVPQQGSTQASETQKSQENGKTRYDFRWTPQRMAQYPWWTEHLALASRAVPPTKIVDPARAYQAEMHALRALTAYFTLNPPTVDGMLTHSAAVGIAETVLKLYGVEPEELPDGDFCKRILSQGGVKLSLDQHKDTWSTAIRSTALGLLDMNKVDEILKSAQSFRESDPLREHDVSESYYKLDEILRSTWATTALETLELHGEADILRNPRLHSERLRPLYHHRHGSPVPANLLVRGNLSITLRDTRSIALNGARRAGANEAFDHWLPKGLADIVQNLAQL